MGKSPCRNYHVVQPKTKKSISHKAKTMPIRSSIVLRRYPVYFHLTCTNKERGQSALHHHNSRLFPDSLDTYNRSLN